MLADLNMAAALGYDPHVSVSVESSLHGPLLLLDFTMSNPDPFPPGFEFAFSDGPFVILAIGQRRPVEVFLIPFSGGIWGNIWPIMIDPTRLLPKCIVAFYYRYGGNLNEIKVDICDIKPILTSIVSY